MKKVLISMVAAGAIVSSVSALEVYKEGDNVVNIFGTIRGVAGYGHSFNSIASDQNNTKTHTNTITGSDILYGLQGNSRIGVDFKYNGFFGAALLALNEKTFQGSADNAAGFRQLYGGYDFGSAGKLLIGKVETLTSMGFSSDIFDGDNGQNGFGGTSTSTRRFQVQYILPMGLSVAISEQEKGINNATSFTRKSIPRFAVSYDYKTDNLVAKVAATYTHGDTAADKSKDAVLVTAGVKPTFGNMYVSAMLTYGLNADLIGEMNTAIPKFDARGHLANLGMTSSAAYTFNGDTNRYAALAEFGYSINESLKAIVGAGYQFTSSYGSMSIANMNGSAISTALSGMKYGKVHSYSAFFQLPYAVSKNFSIIPQVGYVGTTVKASSGKGTANKYVGYANTGGIYAIAQARFTF